MSRSGMGKPALHNAAVIAAVSGLKRVSLDSLDLNGEDDSSQRGHGILLWDRSEDGNCD